MLCLSACMDVAPVTSLSSAGTAVQDEGALTSTAISCVTGCEDDDPCTEDACVDNACTHVAVAGCSIYACNSLGVMDAEVLVDLEDGALWKAAASPAVSTDVGECSNDVCDAATPCCNTCPATLGLGLDGGLLSSVSTDQNVPWGCAIDECGEVSACAPLSLDATYWLWGRAERLDDDVTHVVQGWCLQTNTEALPGVYTGSWVSGTGEAHTIELTIEHMGSWLIGIKGLRECPACTFSVPSQFANGIAIRDGGLDFDISVCDDGDACVNKRPVAVTLSSHRDQLIGTFEEQQNFGGGFDAPYTGAVGLVRLVP